MPQPSVLTKVGDQVRAQNSQTPRSSQLEWGSVEGADLGSEAPLHPQLHPKPQGTLSSEFTCGHPSLLGQPPTTTLQTLIPRQASRLRGHILLLQREPQDIRPAQTSAHAFQKLRQSQPGLEIRFSPVPRETSPHWKGMPGGDQSLALPRRGPLVHV